MPQDDGVKAVPQLERKYARRGLKFVVPFEGSEPMQAFGHLDGKRFYFHLRGNTASLTVGRFDREVEVRRASEQDERLGYVVSGTPLTQPVEEDAPDLFPSVIELQSREEVNGRKLLSVFSSLVDSLKPVEGAE